MKHTILYTSDVHGNEVQYKLLFEYAQKVQADSIITLLDYLAPVILGCGAFS